MPLVLAVVRKVVLNGWGTQVLLHHRGGHTGSVQGHLAMCRTSQCVIGCSPVLVLVNAGVELVQHLAVMDRAGLDGVVLVVVAALSRNVVSPQGARGQIMSGVIGWVNILMADVALSGDVIASQVVRSQVVSAVAGCADVLMTDVTLDRNFILPQVLVAQAMVGSTNVVLVGIVDGTSSGCAMALVRDIVMNRSIMSPQVVRG